MTEAVIEAPYLCQDPQEFELLLALYRQHEPQRILEIGCLQGGSLYHWLGYAPDDATVVAVDENHKAGLKYKDWVPRCVTLHTIKGDSGDPDIALQVAEHGPFDWIFIDGDHTEKAVRRDWELYAPMAAPRSYVVFHDIIDHGDEGIMVCRLWDELRLHHATVEFRLSYMGTGVLRMPG